MSGDGRRREAPTDGDPRLCSDRVRTVSGPSGSVTLVGAVHDHPASAYRAATVVERRDPDVLALELPPLALPLFEAESRDRASEGAVPPAVGGEMSAAIRAAETDRVVAIDGPSMGFLGTLAVTLAREQPALGTIRTVLAGVASAGTEAVRCRVAGAVATHTPIRLDGRTPVDHDCSAADDPAVQADDEHRQIGRARAVMDAFEPSRAAQFRDATREAHMADRLAALRREGGGRDVVAVVGYGHLDSLEARLRDEAE